MESFEKTPPEARELLGKPISELGLKIEGSYVEPFVHRLYAELEQAGLRHFRPACYLSDQWGCPSEEPVIGIPFYLADPRLQQIEQSVNDIETDAEVMMYLRHEAGHAFNYAYELYQTEEWRELFGPFRRAYRDAYKPVPFSRRYVRHIAGWYAQKHPDEDFAETFAVWMTPGSGWRARYAGWAALRKLEYVDRVGREVADMAPVRPMGEVDFTVDEMDATVEQFYRENTPDEEAEIAGLALDTDLADIFRGGAEGDGSVDAAAIIRENRRTIVDKTAYWSGVRRSLIKALVDAMERRVAELKLCVRREDATARVVELTAYVTTLAMNYLARGRFTTA